MSKSKGNTVAVADILAEHGADVFRAYEMFLGAFEKGKSWNTEGINGVKRWLERVWSMYEKVDDEAEMEDSEKAEVKTFIKLVTDDIAAFKFNTAIAKLMVLTNKMMKMEKIPRPLAEIFCKLIAPFAPMISEEIWCNVLKNEFSVHKSEWPEYDETMSALKITTIAVQINGNLIFTLDLDGIQAQDEEVVTSQARLTDGYKRHIEGKEVDRTIFVPGKVLNVVTTDAVRKPKGQV